MKSKLAILVLTLMILSISLISIATVRGADDFTIYSKTDGSTWLDFTEPHPSYINEYSAMCGAFEVFTDGYLTRVEVFVRGGGSATTWINCTVEYATSSVLSYPNGTVFAQSTTIVNGSDLVVGGDWQTFYFNGTAQLKTDTWYVVCIYAYGTVGTTPNYISWIYKNASPHYDSYWKNNAWTECTGTTSMVLYANIDSAPEPTPTPAPTDIPTLIEDEDVTAFISMVAPLAVIFAPLLLFVAVGKQKPTKWIIIICVCLGVGLATIYFALPVWLVVLVAIAVVGLAYQDVRGG